MPERVEAVVSPESAPIKRIIREAEDKGNLINATYGRRTRAVIVTDSGPYCSVGFADGNGIRQT